MKKASTSGISRVFKYFFDVRNWSDYDRMRGFTNYIIDGFRKLFIPPKLSKTDAFKKKMLEYNLNEQDLLTKEKSLMRLSLFMLIIAGTILVYVIYCLVSHAWRASFLSVIVMGLALVLAFRYNFWCFQMRERRLNCTIMEWIKQLLKIKFK